MTLKDVVLGAAGRKLVTIDGDEELVALQPPASPARVDEIERELGFPLVAELRELLSVTAGLDFFDGMDLARIGPCPHQELFAWTLTTATDGAGNYWVIEIRPGQQVLGPVWFLCHDAPVLVYQSPDLATFVADYLRFSAAPHDGPVKQVVENAVQDVWMQKLDVPRAELLSSPDDLLRTFASALPENWFIRDLRHARVGDGMPIGRFGPRTPLARAGDEFVFAYGSRTRLERLKTWFTGR